MYYYVDESGHTGLKLFDGNQPNLYYGVLSASVDLDAVVELHVKKLRDKLGVERLHAAELGVGRLLEICEALKVIKRKNGLRFDFYRVAKKDHAAITFFDQVFDQGVNKAVPWTAYWTPLRYPLLVTLAGYFDEDLLKKSWEARTCVNDAEAQGTLVYVCNELLVRVQDESDARMKEIFIDALTWAASNPEEIGYNVASKKDALQISPNLIGFQSVMHGIAARIEEDGVDAVRVVVDRQGEFNKAQEHIAKFYSDGRDVPWVSGPGLPEMKLKHMPFVPISCTPGTSSAGLELVDVFLWLFKRCAEGKDVPDALVGLVNDLSKHSRLDEVSLMGIKRKWEEKLSSLPEPSAEEAERLKKAIACMEVERKKNMLIK